jgi:hypothetical protein
VPDPDGSAGSWVEMPSEVCRRSSRYIRGLLRWLDRQALCQILGRGLARLAVNDRFELDLLAFSERAHIGAFNRADMDENVLASVFRLNEAESLLGVEELNYSNLHDMPFK